MTAAVDICNMSLDMLKQSPISALDDGSANANRFARNFDIIRDAFLSSHPWNFAIARASIAADATAPSFGWDYRYTVPADAVRVLPLRYDGEFEGALLPHEIEAGYILTDQESPLKVIYIKSQTDYGLWSPAAIVAFATLMAMQMAHAITGKASIADVLREDYKLAFSEAKRVDGLQGWAERPDHNDVIAVRTA